MSQQAGYSPSFKRPAEIMRMRRQRARSEAGVFSIPSGRVSTDSPGQSNSSPASVRPFSPGPLFNAQNRSGGGTKRRNPFANIENTFSPRNKLLIYNEDGEAEEADGSRVKKRTDAEGDEEVSKKHAGRWRNFFHCQVEWGRKNTRMCPARSVTLEISSDIRLLINILLKRLFLLAISVRWYKVMHTHTTELPF